MSLIRDGTAFRPLPDAIVRTARYQRGPVAEETEPTMAEWYQAKILHLCELNNVEDKKDVLTDIKIKFGTLNNRDAEQVARSLDYGPLYSQLTSNDRYDDE